MLTDEDKQWIDIALGLIEDRIKAVLDGRIDASQESMKDFIGTATRDMETRIISEFWKWGRQADIRYRQDHDMLIGVDARLVALEAGPANWECSPSIGNKANVAVRVRGNHLVITDGFPVTLERIA